MRQIVNISLPKGLYREVEKQVIFGGYASKSAFFQQLVKDWKENKYYQFNAKKLYQLVNKHARKGGLKDLSSSHDKYLYA